MKRRRLLGSISLLLLLPGCLFGPNDSAPTQSVDRLIPTTENSNTQSVTSRIQETLTASRSPRSPPNSTTTPSDFRVRFVDDIQPIGVEVTLIETADSVVMLEYVTTKSGYDELGEEIGAIAGTFFRQVEGGWEVKRLEATILNDSETPLATWHAETKWLEQFQNNEISADELSLRILETLEPVE